MTQKEVPAHHRPAQQTSGHHSTTETHCTGIAAQLRRRRAASFRLQPLAHSGVSDPWPSEYQPPGVNGYQQAALHLLADGLIPFPNVDALRQMWKASNESRRAAAIIAKSWGMAS
jgi:hypothetical protein